MLAALVLLLLAQAPPPVTVRLTLDDGSTLRATAVTPTLTVKTAHGDLKIAVADLRRLDLGPRLTKEEQKQLETALASLASADHAARESATADVLSLGERVYPFLSIKSTDPEVGKRLSQARDALLLRYGQHRVRTLAPDSFSTATVSGTGQVVDSKLRVRTLCFAETDVDIAHVRSLVVLDSTEASISVLAPTTDTLSWLDTGIDLSNSPVRLSASGTIDLWPQTAGQYMVGPRGGTAGGRGSQFSAGALLYRIGESGTPGLAGDDCRLSGRGRLFLAIVPSIWNSPAAGEYRVRVQPE